MTAAHRAQANSGIGQVIGARQVERRQARAHWTHRRDRSVLSGVAAWWRVDEPR